MRLLKWALRRVSSWQEKTWTHRHTGAGVHRGKAKWRQSEKAAIHKQRRGAMEETKPASSSWTSSLHHCEKITVWAPRLWCFVMAALANEYTICYRSYNEQRMKLSYSHQPRIVWAESPCSVNTCWMMSRCLSTPLVQAAVMISCMNPELSF